MIQACGSASKSSTANSQPKHWNILAHCALGIWYVVALAVNAFQDLTKLNQDLTRCKGVTSASMDKLLGVCGRTLSSLILQSTSYVGSLERNYSTTASNSAFRSISDKSVRVIAAACSNLVHLDLSWSAITDDGVTALTRANIGPLRALKLMVGFRVPVAFYASNPCIFCFVIGCTDAH